MPDLESRLARAALFAKYLTQIETLANSIFDVADHEDQYGSEATAADYYYAGEQLRKLASDLDHHTTN